MTNSLWKKLYECFFIHFDTKKERFVSRNSEKQTIEYIENETGNFEGIIHYLTEKFGGNVVDKGVCKVSSSSVFDKYVPKNVFEFVRYATFSSDNKEGNQWLKIDFLNRKVHPTHYTIKTVGNKRGGQHLKNWVLEGSNTDRDDDWKILDSRSNENSLNYSYAENTFKIQNDLGFFRFIRLRQYGANTRNCHSLVLSGLEFFGSISN